MGNTTMRPSGAKHSLIIRVDERGRGSYHAAVPTLALRGQDGMSWLTACGEHIVPTDVLDDVDAALVIEFPTRFRHPLCKRCDRVGNAQ